MRYLLILDGALFALTATLAMVLGVVWVMYAFHTDLAARISTEMSLVAATMLVFAAMSAPLGLAFWSLLRQRSWHWWAQLGGLAAVVCGSLLLYRLVT